MFKWPGSPSPEAPIPELADFAELMCWRDGNTSATSLSQLIGRVGEADYSDGVPAEDEGDTASEEVYLELERRQTACGSNYPFVIDKAGRSISLFPGGINDLHILYRYLLLATRLNMKTGRTHAGFDGTRLFELLSAEVAREYFGQRAKSLVFGTASDNPRFEAKVNDLCARLGEGGGYTRRPGRATRAKDGKLDVVVWVPFVDSLPSKFIGFGQCKTGTNYRDDTTQLQPEAFREKWLDDSLYVTPIRMFFISEALAQTASERAEVSLDAGLLFDRCRLIDCASSISAGLMANITSWTNAAALANGLP